VTVAVIDARERQFVVLAQGTDLIAPLVSQATTARDETIAARNVATGARDQAVTAAGTAVAALGATSITGTYPTKAEMDAAAGPFANGVYLAVIADEAQGGERTIYRKVSGSMVFVDFALPKSYRGTLTNLSGPTTRQVMQMPDVDDGGGNNNRADLSLNVGRFPFAANHEGSGAPYAYVDDVGSITMNMDPNRNLRNTENGGFGLFFESKFWQAGIFNTEMQMCAGGLDGSARRVFQGIFPEDGVTRGKSNLSTGVDKWLWLDYYGALRATYDIQNGIFDHEGATRYDFKGNNHAPHRQINAAGNDYIALPFINNQDFQVTSAPTLYLRAAKNNATYGIHGAHVEQISALASGSYVERVFGNAVTGNLYGFSRVFPVSGELLWEFHNNGSGKSVIDLKADSGAANAELRVNGQKVVSARGAAVADATDAASAITQLNALLSRLRAHGLIAS